MPQDNALPDRPTTSTSSNDMDVTELHRKTEGVDGDARHDASHSLTPTDSPCVAVCSTLYDDICRGCGRTAMEVANWVFFDDEEKRQIWLRIKAQGYPRRKG